MKVGNYAYYKTLYAPPRSWGVTTRKYFCKIIGTKNKYFKIKIFGSRGIIKLVSFESVYQSLELIDFFKGRIMEVQNASLLSRSKLGKKVRRKA